MTFVTVHCPRCDSEQIVKRGKTRRGTQRYLCQNTACITRSFLLHYRNRVCLPEVKQQIIDMSLNASGVRDTARSLHISPATVLSALKKQESVNMAISTFETFPDDPLGMPYPLCIVQSILPHRLAHESFSDCL